MKKAICFVFIFSILLSSVSKTIIYLHYISNKNYYSEVLCVNKAKPAMHCNGHCHLKKELTKDENRANLPVNSLKSALDISLYSQDIHAFRFSEPELTNENLFSYSYGISSPHLKAVFHPPAC